MFQAGPANLLRLSGASPKALMVPVLLVGISSAPQGSIADSAARSRARFARNDPRSQRLAPAWSAEWRSITRLWNRVSAMTVNFPQSAVDSLS
jgi:hypothetical protein